MLKRKADSPSPPWSDVAGFATRQDEEFRKRRRVVAPELDGNNREWAEKKDTEAPDSSSEMCDDDDCIDQNTGDDCAQPTAPDALATIERYRSINALLHELHATNHDRHMHSALSPPDTHPTSPSQFIHHHRSAPKVSLYSSCPPLRGEEAFLNVEEHEVKRHYEETNRTLRDSFLHRRRTRGLDS